MSASSATPSGVRTAATASARRGPRARFWLLVLVLTATAVLVTVAMFRALYIVMG